MFKLFITNIYYNLPLTLTSAIIPIEFVVICYIDFIHNIQIFPKYFYVFLKCGEYMFFKREIDGNIF